MSGKASSNIPLNLDRSSKASRPAPSKRSAGRRIGILAAVLIGSCSPNDTAHCLRDGQGIDALRQHLNLSGERGCAGAGVIREGDRPLRWSSRNFDPATTRFWIASISKPVAATAAVRLAEQGKLDLNMKVADAFPEVTDEIHNRTLAQL